MYVITADLTNIHSMEQIYLRVFGCRRGEEDKGKRVDPGSSIKALTGNLPFYKGGQSRKSWKMGGLRGISYARLVSYDGY